MALGLISCGQSVSLEKTVTPETALRSYIDRDDSSYQWVVKDSAEANGVQRYELLLTSQKWQSFTWVHRLTVFIPAQVDFDKGFLFINGGNVRNGAPTAGGTNDILNIFVSKMAKENRAVTAVVSQVPNQPLYNGLKEDALISKTLHEFKQTNDYTKPLLFPMVKSAVKAMDAVEELAKAKKVDVSAFMVSGASKRGWTTWLTAAVDKRVIAIGPMVIDILNMPKSLAYQIETFGEYSEQINDYVELGITEDIDSKSGDALVKMIDPYSYRDSLDMPKLLFMGTNDPYWVVDNVKNYLGDLPGRTLLHYVPNTGHNLAGGLSAFNTLNAFFAATLTGTRYPEVEWNILGGEKSALVKMDVSPENFLGAKVWSASSTTKDFRKAKWTSKDVPTSLEGKFSVKEKLPQTGYGAFYVELIFKGVHDGQYSLSSRVFMTGPNGIL